MNRDGEHTNHRGEVVGYHHMSTGEAPFLQWHEHHVPSTNDRYVIQYDPDRSTVEWLLDNKFTILSNNWVFI